MSSIGADIAWFRAEQEKLLLCTGRVVRPDASPPTFDPDTGLYTAVSGPVVYEGPCSVRWGTRTAELRTGEREAIFEGLIGKFPADAPIERGDVLEVLSAQFEPALVGRFLRVKVLELEERQIARVCQLEEMEE